MTHPAIAKGRVALVTGAASGIGLAAAQKFGAAGMKVVVVDLPGEPLETAVAGLKADGIAAMAAGLDVSDRAAIEALKPTVDALGSLSVLMLNAGREGSGGITEGEAVWRRTIDTNFYGVLNFLQVFLPALTEGSEAGAVIVTGSKQGITLPPGNTAYNVSKAALRALTESLSHDLVKATGKRVTAHLLIPGFTYTGLTKARGVSEKPDAAWTGEQVVDFLLDGMARGDFYVLCPDNEVTREMDLKRMRWGMGDIVENRPALSRWHPDHAEAFAAYMKE